MLRIIDIDYLRDYKLRVTFNDGVVKLVDLGPHLHGPVFSRLLPHDEFVQYAIVRGTIEWANGIDMAAEFLYKIGEEEPQTNSSGNRLRRFFEAHREINVSGFAERIGLNPQLLSNYIHGHKNPSEEREEMILASIRELGAEYQSVH